MNHQAAVLVGSRAPSQPHSSLAVKELSCPDVVYRGLLNVKANALLMQPVGRADLPPSPIAPLL